LARLIHQWDNESQEWGLLPVADLYPDAL
jgi:hypothetical protein